MRVRGFGYEYSVMKRRGDGCLRTSILNSVCGNWSIVCEFVSTLTWRDCSASTTPFYCFRCSFNLQSASNAEICRRLVQSTKGKWHASVTKISIGTETPSNHIQFNYYTYDKLVHLRRSPSQQNEYFYEGCMAKYYAPNSNWFRESASPSRFFIWRIFWY